ncbi:CEI_1a_G0020130.mRNA.1.CDS.1 [Saccharomyces cerevisiae]|nr:EM14S01-3B_G0033210.mRNA.1.CDS.1 [Saccharomyces cerevisiae]CAI4474422.1 AMH_1a_G0020190.mRNA.1.CDS.1 [Saccharomyces cerevisiae]CAI4485763.1 CEI_1a_G0020130.mRNA.1.CDS.1 [Saccharomyces cerevisiae]CAI6672969.1 AMH_1a_G0020190.mRNA.1.CDS.1 [Saccharomyces cerevisiae]CAI7301013.1 CEI_1a_G0020130.mRNA.1.CDS.1 [Saccharomyces cerevisiae]
MLLTPAKTTRTEDSANSTDDSSKSSNSFMRAIVSSLMVKPITSLTNTVTCRQSSHHNSSPSKITRYDLIKAAAENDLKRSKSQGQEKPRRNSNRRNNEEIFVANTASEIQRTKSSI